MYSLPSLITTNALTSTQTNQTTKGMRMSCKMVGPLPITAKSLRAQRKIIQHRKRKFVHRGRSGRILVHAPRCSHTCVTDQVNLIFDSWICTIKLKIFCPGYTMLKVPGTFCRIICQGSITYLAHLRKLTEPAVVSADVDDKKAFLADCKNSGDLDADINGIIECYLNLPEIPDPTHNPLSFACICK